MIVFSNVPYQISSDLINYIIRYRNYIDKAYFTFQKEFADKLAAKPSTGQYNFLSCYIQYYAKIKELFDIPPSAFRPHPKVNSCFLQVEFYRRLPYKARDEEFLFSLIRKAFSQRRKKISNSLKCDYCKDTLKALSVDLNVNLSRRPEEISLEDYCRIADYLGRRLR